MRLPVPPDGVMRGAHRELRGPQTLRAHNESAHRKDVHQTIFSVPSSLAMAASVSTTSAAISAAGRRCRRPPPGRFSADLRSKNCPSSMERHRSTSRPASAARRHSNRSCARAPVGVSLRRRRVPAGALAARSARIRSSSADAGSSSGSWSTRRPSKAQRRMDWRRRVRRATHTPPHLPWPSASAGDPLRPRCASAQILEEVERAGRRSPTLLRLGS